MTKRELKQKAYEEGTELKIAIAEITGKRVNECMHSFMFKMIQALTNDQIFVFIDTLMRICNKYSVSFPSVLLECLEDRETFDVVSRAYMIALLL